MQKHPSLSSLKSLTQFGVCPFFGQVLVQPVPVSLYAFSRYLRRSSLVTKPSGYKVYGLPCGCYLWVHYSGVRQLSALPF
jgi:hypothetical protein